MNYKAPRGTHDIWGSQARLMEGLELVGRRIFSAYDFTEIRMPTFEDAALFTRSIGEATDIVEKEMYVFADRKGRQLALRPEGTASVVRAYVEHGLAQTMAAAKLFYIGSMFRYERPQAGRYREFFQMGAECFGNAAPTADAEIILLAHDILSGAGIKDIKVHLHTLGCAKCRPAFREALKEYFGKQRETLCADCQRRLERNPLRLLDCKIDGPKFQDLPHMEDFLCEECRDHFCRVQELLSSAGCAYTVDHRMVRGIDYYTKTIFEIRSGAVGSQDALAAGGRYDNLVEELGGSPTPAVGFALGSERVLMAVQNSGGAAPESIPLVFIATVSQALEKEAFRLAARLRRGEGREALGLAKDAPAAVEGPFSDRSLKSQLRLADKLGAHNVVIFGEEEFKRGAVMLKDMKTQQQQEVALSSL